VTIVSLALAAALAGAPVSKGTRQPVVDCSITRLDACLNTNFLAWDPAFNRAVRRFLGTSLARHIYAGRLNEQQVDVLGGPPDPPERIGNLYRFTACRHHECSEKGAVVLEPQGLIVASAILHSTCNLRESRRECFNEQVLSVYVREPVSAKPIVTNLVAWAKDEIAASYDDPVSGKARLSAVEVYSVATGRPKRITLD
jgi:hypothetical protein